MIKKQILETIANAIILAQDSRQLLQYEPSWFDGLTISDAYVVTGMVHAQRIKQGWTVIGRKIGFTNRDMWALFGVAQPVWSFVYEETYLESNSVQFDCDLKSFVQPKIEPEIVICLKEIPRLGVSQEDVFQCIDWFAHGIEMVQCHYPEWKFGSVQAVCDSSFHGKLIVGVKNQAQQNAAADIALLKNCEVSLLCDDKLVEVGWGRNVLDSPLLALQSLQEAIAREGDRYPLMPGEIITTGTMTKAYTVQAGEVWKTAFTGESMAGLVATFV